jgi:hypothetical protein
MKKLITGVLALLMAVQVVAQTFPVNNLQVNGTSNFNGTATFNGTLTGAGIAALPFAPTASPSFTGLSHFTNTSAGASVQELTGNGAVTPNKFVGVLSGNYTIFSSNGASQLLGLTDAGVLSTLAPIPVSTGGTGSATATGATTNLQYLQGGAGGVARPLTSKFQDIVSVRDFGATGNGVTNDTAAVNSAIVAACGSGAGGAVGGLVTFPAGNYLITTGAVVVTQANCYLTGVGVDATIITPAGTTGNVISFTGSQNQGMSLIQIAYGTPPTSGAGVSVGSSVIGFYLHDVNVIGAFVGVVDAGGAGHFYQTMTILNTVATSGLGMQFFGNGQADTVRDVIINGSVGAQPQAGIEISNNSGLTLDNVDVLHSGTGLLINPQNPTDAVAWLFAVNAQFDSNGSNGISIVTTNAGHLVKGLNFSNSWSASNTGAGIIVSGSAGTISGIRVVGHRSFNNGSTGISLGFGTDISISSSDISGNSQTTPGVQAGITAAINRFSITDCRIGQEAGFGNTQSFGINVLLGAWSNTTIIGNNVQGNLTGGITDSGTGLTKVVKGNTGYNPIASTPITVGASPFTFTNNTGDTVGVLVSTGTVSNISLGVSTVGASTNAVVAVPQGQSLTVTYSSIPLMAYLGY